MAWIDMIHEGDAEGELAEAYAGILSARGKLSNIMRIHSLNPAAMTDHMDLYMTVMFGRSKLRRAEREMIATVVSAANECPYCIHHHAEALNHYWKDPDRIETLIADPDSAGLTERESAIVDHAFKLTRHPGQSTKADVSALKAAGLGDREVLDVTLITAYFNFVNRIALGLGVEFSDEEMKGYEY